MNHDVLEYFLRMSKAWVLWSGLQCFSQGGAPRRRAKAETAGGGDAAERPIRAEGVEMRDGGNTNSVLSNVCKKTDLPKWSHMLAIVTCMDCVRRL